MYLFSFYSRAPELMVTKNNWRSFYFFEEKSWKCVDFMLHFQMRSNVTTVTKRVIKLKVKCPDKTLKYSRFYFWFLIKLSHSFSWLFQFKIKLSICLNFLQYERFKEFFLNSWKYFWLQLKWYIIKVIVECLHLRDYTCFRIKIFWIELFAKNGELTRQLNYSQSKEYDEKGWYFWMRCEDKLE